MTELLVGASSSSSTWLHTLCSPRPSWGSHSESWSEAFRSCGWRIWLISFSYVCNSWTHFILSRLLQYIPEASGLGWLFTHIPWLAVLEVGWWVILYYYFLSSRNNTWRISYIHSLSGNICLLGYIFSDDWRVLPCCLSRRSTCAWNSLHKWLGVVSWWNMLWLSWRRLSIHVLMLLVLHLAIGLGSQSSLIAWDSNYSLILFLLRLNFQSPLDLSSLVGHLLLDSLIFVHVWRNDFLCSSQCLSRWLKSSPWPARPFLQH